MLSTSSLGMPSSKEVILTEQIRVPRNEWSDDVDQQLT